MPYSMYLPDDHGTVTMSPEGPFEAGSFQELVLRYTAGKFGLDDTGMLKISWRTTSDMGKPQFDKPDQPNFTTVEASNGATLECRVDRVNIRPWANTLVIRVGRGFLRPDETIAIRLGDRRQGSPGLRLQTNCEQSFGLKMFVDAFATYEFVELPKFPNFELIAGPAVRWSAVWPSEIVGGEPFRLAINAWDRWGNPTTDASEQLTFKASRPIQRLPTSVSTKSTGLPMVLDGLVVEQPGSLELIVGNAQGRELTRANPTRVVGAAVLRRYWGDLHGQSGETVGTNPADLYFKYARDQAFVDIVGHQGNDFQITDTFWAELNRLTASYEIPGKFLAVPGYEWSGNTGLGGDRNVFYRSEGRPIRRSSRILIGETAAENTDCHTAHNLFVALKNEDAVVIAHVGGRYADIGYAHDETLERSVEIHSTWGTFEWLLHDAFARGYRLGVVCHSDDHKGRQGATGPGASVFGAMGGLTCYFMHELTRDALFKALRRRHHYGTTGARIWLDVTGHFERPVDVYHDSSAVTVGRAMQKQEAMMGDIVRAAGCPMTLQVTATGTAPIDRVEVFHGANVVAQHRTGDDVVASRRVRVLWQGAEYRGRGRETLWNGQLAVTGNRMTRFASVNFLNPERPLRETTSGTGLAWQSVTTGNMAGIDAWLEESDKGHIKIGTNIASLDVDLARLGDEPLTHDAGGLGRRLSVYRLPEGGGPRTMSLTHTVTHSGANDIPVMVRVTQEDGHQAWSSPIYLIP